VADFGRSKAGGTISQKAAVHPWLAADAHGNKQETKSQEREDFISCGGILKSRLNILLPLNKV
jgi:hypothetical protein